MPCEHFQAQDLITLAEKTLNDKKIPKQQWENLKFGYRENVDAWGAKSIYTEVTFKENQWVITAIDRKQEPVVEEKLGLQSY